MADLARSAWIRVVVMRTSSARLTLVRPRVRIGARWTAGIAAVTGSGWVLVVIVVAFGTVRAHDGTGCRIETNATISTRRARGGRLFESGVVVELALWTLCTLGRASRRVVPGPADDARGGSTSILVIVPGLARDTAHHSLLRV